MILPGKHIRIADSLVGMGALVVETLDHPKELDVVWRDLLKIRAGRKLKARADVRTLILCLDFLYSLGLVEMLPDGRVCRASH